jgi:predicted GNAT family acetyltransferase
MPLIRIGADDCVGLPGGTSWDGVISVQYDRLSPVGLPCRFSCYPVDMTEPQDNPAERRFELQVEGETAFAAYRIAGETIIFTHTIVPKALEGQGIATGLIAFALDQARARGLKVVPECSFVAAYMQRHPDTQDLLAS